MATHQHNVHQEPEELPARPRSAHKMPFSGGSHDTVERNNTRGGNSGPKWTMGILSDKETEEVPGGWYINTTILHAKLSS